MTATNRGILVGVVLALAAIATLFWLVGSGPPEDTSAGSSPHRASKRDDVRPVAVDREHPTDASSSVRSEVAAPAIPQSPSADTESSNSELTSVKGHVVDEEDATIAGAEVEVWYSDAFEQRSMETTTGPDGTFAFAELNPQRQACLRVRLTRHDDIELDLPRLRPGANDLGKLVAKLGGGMVGRLVDEHGALVAGAKVTASMQPSEGSVPDVFPHERTGTTDERGEFRIEGLRPGMCRVTASTGSNAVSQDQITIVKGKHTDPIELRLKSGLKLVGTVRDSRGTPVAGARLSLYPALKGRQGPRGGVDRKAETDADGRFEFQDMLEVPYSLFLYADGFLDVKDTLRPSQDPIEIVVHRPGTVVGRVRTAESAAPVAQFEVTFYQRGGDGILSVNRIIKALTGQPAGEHAGTTDTAGLFVIPAAPRTNVAIKISADGFADTLHGPFDVPAGQRVDVTIDLKRETTVAGVVLDANDEGVAGAQVTIRPRVDAKVRFRPGALPDSSKRVTSQAGGVFKIGGLSAGDVFLEASHEGSVASEPVELRLRPQSTVSGVELKLRAAGALEGQALDADSKPLPGGNVVLTPEAPDSQMKLTAKASLEGRFVFRGLAPGRYYAELKSPSDAIPFITASPPGPDGRPIGTLVIIEPGETTEVTLTLARKASLSGVVTAAGRPLQGAVVSVPVSVFDAARVQTKADGRFAFGDLEPREWTVSVRAPGAPLSIERAVTLRAGEEAHLDVAVSLGAISGRVVGENGEPQAGLEVQLTGSCEPMVTNRSARPAITDQDGRYELTFVEPGRYRVSLAGRGVARSYRDPIEVAADQHVAAIDFKAVPGATLIATVTLPHGEPPASFSVNATREGDEAENYAASGAGREPARLEGLPPGRYRIDARHFTMVAEATIEIVGREEKRVMLELR